MSMNKYLIKGLVLISVIGILAAIFIPNPGSIPPTAPASVMLEESKVAQAKIAENLLKCNHCPINIDASELIKKKTGTHLWEDELMIDFRHISNNGTIIMYSKLISTYLELTPEIKNHEIYWSCSGHPAERMPPQCR